MKGLQIPQKLVYEKIYVHEKILRSRNFRRGFIKNLLPEKRKENMQTEQPQFKSRLNETESKIENPTYIFREMNLVLQLI